MYSKLADSISEEKKVVDIILFYKKNWSWLHLIIVQPKQKGDTKVLAFFRYFTAICLVPLNERIQCHLSLTVVHIILVILSECVTVEAKGG